MLYDLEKKAVVGITQDIFDKYQPEEIRQFDDDMPFFRQGEDFEKTIQMQVRRSDVDFIGHVHNTAYLEFANELVPDEYLKTKSVKSFRVVYRRQLQHGDIFEVRLSRKDDKLLMGIYKDDTLYAGVEQTWE